MATTETADALDRGEAFVELSDAHVTRVSGADARAWLHDLVTTEVDSLAPGQARPSLLLTPTGRIRAQFQVAAVADGFLLIEREPFETPVATALSPYVLSSIVEIASADVAVVSVPGLEPGDPRLEHLPGDLVAPSILGGGVDVVAVPDSIERLRELLATGGLHGTDLGVAEARRIRRGDPRFGFELDAESLPAEAGLDVAPVTDRTKGCFLGQESIARVANLGHPTRVLVPVRYDGELADGDAVLAAGEPVGVLTSANDRSAIARLSWSARDRALETASGAVLERVGRP